MLLWVLPWCFSFLLGKRDLEIPQLGFLSSAAPLSPLLLPMAAGRETARPFPCSRVACVEVKGRQEQRRWDSWAGLFLSVAQCAAPPASASRIWRGQTLRLAKGFVPPRRHAFCFGGSAPSAAESRLCLPAASMLQRQPGSARARAARERKRVVSCGPIPGTGVSPKSPASGDEGELMLPGRAARCCQASLPSCTMHSRGVWSCCRSAPDFIPSCCPGSLGHSLGIPQQLQTLLGSRGVLSAMHFFLLHEELGAGEVRACSAACSSLGFFSNSVFLPAETTSVN